MSCYLLRSVYIAIVGLVIPSSGIALAAGRVQEIPATWHAKDLRRVAVASTQASSMVESETGQYTSARAVDGHRGTKWVADKKPSPASPQWIDRLMGISYVGDMNEKIETGEYREIIQISEALHEKKIAQINLGGPLGPKLAALGQEALPLGQDGAIVLDGLVHGFNLGLHFDFLDTLLADEGIQIQPARNKVGGVSVLLELEIEFHLVELDGGVQANGGFLGAQAHQLGNVPKP